MRFLLSFGIPGLLLLQGNRFKMRIGLSAEKLSKN